MINKVFIVSALISLTLTACSSDDGGGGGVVPSQLTGVWDVSTTSGQVVDEYYTVIRSDGTGSDYDYLGDSFDQGPNCYLVDDYTIRSLGSRNYELDFGDGDVEVINVTVEDDTMTVEIPNFGTFSYPRSNLQESDLTPIC